MINNGIEEKLKFELIFFSIFQPQFLDFQATMSTPRQSAGICMHWSPEVLLLINLAQVLSYTP